MSGDNWLHSIPGIMIGIQRCHADHDDPANGDIPFQGLSSAPYQGS